MGDDVETVLTQLRDGAAITWDGIAVTTAVIRGRRMLFCTDTHRDIVQKTQRDGQFYETEELDRIAEIFPKGGTFLDVGSNVGNHALFVAAFCKPAKVIPIEPNPRAWRLLLANVVLNGLVDVFDFSRLGFGLSDRDAGGFQMQVKGRRLGSLRMEETGGELSVRRGDTFLADSAPDLIKVDVEGMELSTLSGLDGLIERVAPKLMVEVEAANDYAFRTWLGGHAYEIVESFTVNGHQNNYIAVKSDREGPDD